MLDRDRLGDASGINHHLKRVEDALHRLRHGHRATSSSVDVILPELKVAPEAEGPKISVPGLVLIGFLEGEVARLKRALGEMGVKA